MKAYFQKPIDEEFNDSYSRSGLQPSVGSVQQFRKVEVDRGGATHRVGTSAQVAGAGTQVAGKGLKVTGTAMRAAGKGMSTGGSAMIRAGAGMSSTGVGAIVGVPTVILGAGVKVIGRGTRAAGAAVNAAGKTTNQAGKVVGKAGNNVKKIGRLQVGRRSSPEPSRPKDKVLAAAKRLPGPVGKIAEHGGGALKKVWARKKVTRANLTIGSIGYSMWVGIQLPLASLSLGYLGVAFTIKTIQEKVNSVAEALVGETVTYVISTIYKYTIGAGTKAFDYIFEQIFGFSLAAIGDPTNWFTATYYLVVLFGWATLLVAVTIYVFSMVNPFFGKGAAWKMGGFLVSVVGYLIPGLNILPWFAVYTAAVWTHPE